MKLASLKQKYSEMESKPSGVDTDEYFPSLYLSDKQIDALGIDTAKIGTEMTMMATVKLTSISASQGGSRSMSFDIVEAAIEPKEKKPEASSILFPNG